VTLHFVDHTAPAAPVITAPKDGDTINKADLNPDGTTTITGTGEPDDTVTVTDATDPSNPATLCTATVAADGSWSCTATLPQGEDTIQAWQTDPSGNQSPDSPAVHVSVDTVAPAAPVITAPKDGDTINKADLNPDGTTTVTGTGEPGASADVTLNGKPLDGCQDLTVTAAGTWTCTAVFPQGTDTLVASQTDPAGNASVPSAPVTVNVDTVAPAAPVITEPLDGDTINAGDVNPDGTSTITGTGEPDATVTVTDSTDPSNPVTLCTATVGQDGSWSCTATLPQGNDTLTAQQKDPAGNPSADSPAVHVTVDTVAPGAPVITAPKDGSTLNKAGVDPEGKATITGTGEPGASVDVTLNGTPLDGCQHVSVAADGTWTCAATLPQGSDTLVASQTDPAGNASVPSAPVTVNVDTVVPDAPVITSPKQGDLTNDNTPVITGTGEPGATVTVTDTTDPSNPAPLCTAVVAPDGTWSCTSSKLADGSHTIQATQTDPAGNTSVPSAPVSVTVDTQAPAAPVVNPSNGTELSGTTEPGATVTIHDGSGNTIPGCENVVANAQGSFQCTPTTRIPDGTVVRVTATDKAGNTSPATTITIQTITVPAGPTVAAPTGGSVAQTGTGLPGALLGLLGLLFAGAVALRRRGAAVWK